MLWFELDEGGLVNLGAAERIELYDPFYEADRRPWSIHAVFPEATFPLFSGMTEENARKHMAALTVRLMEENFTGFVTADSVRSKVARMDHPTAVTS